ncbi:MAG: hypothetical protein IPN29_04765 [Saprospiraceae bacterium]|nr:hypothetical protein [Saprospiraceae bacterium]
MVAFIIGILMSLGLINSSTEFFNMSQQQRHQMVQDWVGDEDPGGI